MCDIKKVKVFVSHHHTNNAVMKNIKEKQRQKSDHNTVDRVETPTPPQVMDPSEPLERQQRKKDRGHAKKQNKVASEKNNTA